MKPSLLLPRYFKIVGLLLLVPGVVIGLIFQYKNDAFPYNAAPSHGVVLFASAGVGTFNDEIAITLLISGISFLIFSKQKNENESTGTLRLRSLYWAVLSTQSLICFYLLIDYWGGDLLHISFLAQHSALFDIMTYNLFVPLSIATVRFRYLLWRIKGAENLPPLKLLPFKWFSIVSKRGFALFAILSMWALSPLEDLFSIKIPVGIIILCPVFILLWISSKEKREDEKITLIRLRAMQFAFYVYNMLMIALTWLVYDLGYFAILYVGVVFVPIIFLIVFYLMLFRNNRAIRFNKENNKIIIA